MISRHHQRTLFLLMIVNSVAALIASGVGIFNLDIYTPFTPQKMLPGTLSQDIVSLLAAVGLWVCAWFIVNGSWRAWLVWVSLNGYLLYAYALYSFERLYNPLFLVYIAIAGLSFYSIAGFITWLEPDAVRRFDHSRFPHRVIALYLLALVAMFVSIWMSMIIPGIQTRTPPDGSSIFVIDLAFLLPLLVIASVSLWRRHTFGAIAAPIILVTTAVLGISILLGSLFGPLFGLPISLEEVFVYALLGVGSLALAIYAQSRITLIDAVWVKR